MLILDRFDIILRETIIVLRILIFCSGLKFFILLGY